MVKQNTLGKSKLIVYMSILVMMLVFVGCSQEQNVEEKEEQTTTKNENTRDSITVGLDADVIGFWPEFLDWEMTTEEINFNLFNALVAEENNGIVPSLAKRWINPTPNTWRFYLREGVKFHDGTEFTAEDVKYTMDYILDPNNNQPYIALLAPIERTEVVDDYTVDIITKDPYPSLLTNLFEIGIFSKKHVEAEEAQGLSGWGENGRVPIGTGAYTLKEYVPDSHFVFERFDDYWGGKSEVKTGTFKVIKDPTVVDDMLVSKEIDVALQILSSEYSEEFENNPDIVVGRTNANKVTYVSFDVREVGSHGFPDGENPTSDLRVRQAIYHAIDVEGGIIDGVLKGMGEPASQYVTPNIFGYNPEIKRLPYDVEKAKELMKEAGYEDGFEIVFDCVTDLDVNYPVFCDSVAEDLKAININAIVNKSPKKEFFPKTVAGESSMLLIGWGYDTGDGQEMFDNILFTKTETQAQYNYGFYSNPEVDRIGHESAKEMDSRKRLALMQEGFRIAAADVNWVPLVSPVVLAASSSDLNWHETPHGVQGDILLEEIEFVK